MVDASGPTGPEASRTSGRDDRHHGIGRPGPGAATLGRGLVMSAAPPRAAADRVIIFDTTLRDGEQSPGASMNLDEKIKIALLLEEMGIDVIEAGFPIASNGDFEAVREIAKLVENSIICGLSRAGRVDIDRA